MKTDKRILFTDLDGTLLNSSSRITDYTKQVIRQMKEQGHIFVPTSGRPLFSVLHVLEKSDFDITGSYIIAYNGCVVYDVDKNEIIFSSKVEKELASNVWKLAKDRGVYIQTYLDEHIITPREDENLNFYNEGLDMPVKKYDDLSNLEGSPYKLLSIDLHCRKNLEMFAGEVLGKYGDKLNVLFSSKYYLEIFDKETDKGRAALWLADKLEVDRNNVYGAGDAGNDLGLLKAVKHGIAMKNGDPSLFEHAEIISEYTNDEDGLARVIEKYIVTI